jgi:sugar phosphate isomerase/epimerase
VAATPSAAGVAFEEEGDKMTRSLDIRIGTLVHANQDPERYLQQILPLGFESIELVFKSGIDRHGLPDLAGRLAQTLGKHTNSAIISSVGVYGNPLEESRTADDFRILIESARLFGCSLVCGFAGRLTNRPIPESMSRFREVFSELARVAEANGVRIAFENCDMGGTWDYGGWNIAHSPRAWEMIFNEVPSDAIGLEWEPCHQMVSLIDPLPQLRQWVHKIFHVHGKDATVLWDVVRSKGIRGGTPFVYHRTPGFGDTNWSDVITFLRMGGFRGSIDIEGWHDPVYRDELEMTGQVHALHYLQRCRGGEFTPNPS